MANLSCQEWPHHCHSQRRQPLFGISSSFNNRKCPLEICEATKKIFFDGHISGRIKKLGANILRQTVCKEGSCCGSVVRAVASNTRGPQFESSLWQNFIYILNIRLLSTVYWKDKIKKKRPGMAHFFKKTLHKRQPYM